MLLHVNLGKNRFKIDGKKYFDSVLRYEEKVGSIIKGIVQKIKDADLVIADHKFKIATWSSIAII